MSISKISIYDIDGTLVSSLHRYRTAPCGTRIDLAYWRENDVPEKIMLDSFLPHMAQYKLDLADPSCYVILATARACTKGDANYQFIKEKMGLPDKFVHREGADDTRGGAELKIKGIRPLLNLKQFRDAVIHVFEDNKSYLYDMVQAFSKTNNTIGHYIYSAQGH